MDRFEEALEGLRRKVRERGVDDETLEAIRVLETYRGSELRRKADRADQLEREIAETRAEIARTEAEAGIRATLEGYGVSVGELRPAEWSTLVERIPDDGDLSEEWVARQVSELRLPLRRR